MTLPLAVVVPLFLTGVVVGVFASETKRRVLLGITKPLTTFLLLAVVGSPQSSLAWWIVIGIGFSLGGDVALLSAAKKAFLVGLGLFLGAHLAYTVAFAGAAAAGAAADAGAGFFSPRALGAAAAIAVATTLLLRKLWPGAAGLRGPLVGYALALGAMVVSAFAAVGPGSSTGAASVSSFAAVGAVLFWVADASLALDRFYRPIKHAPLLTLGVYWLGQLGIALAARATNF